MPVSRIAGFAGLAFLLSWTCWLPVTRLPDGVASDPGRALLYAGAFGPLLATLLVLAPASQRDARARWWRRLRHPGGLLSPAGLLCVLLPVLIAQLALDSYALAGGIHLPAAGLADALPLLAATLFLGPLGGEPGWRGHALPELARRREPVAAALVTGLLWAAWQAPLFFMKGTWQAGIALASAAGLVWLATLLAQSLLMTAFYLATRCTWAAVLFQWITGFMGEFWQMPPGAEMHRSLWTVLLAGIVLLVRPPFGLRPPDGPPPR